ncbi:MAG: sterol desaturase family protein [Gammaproteobacteria bacterium]|jgi:sterol desaturase/sphingolipid hydroxylase (fatty acid hydroxylase superfamily)|nr:sterol desaturase family protein [Gammaproteobacteria bacterium]MBT3858919.1 sterol desaturase family protein [Gammaproteobacteria bacterium]MBT3988247.1 sterol desaturase family protein [Gammaproteobacteria bacterium]MBT4256891.1 sterol desaturase family protein [Gammaproteobacteria bacterium]MBT4582517.1 sterol desaturase family protein [Gammaproteobacteria bacterium]
MDLILYAIPFFFLLIFLEIAYGMARGRNSYRINDTINSLSLGSLSRLQALVILGFSGYIYEWIVNSYQLSQLPDDRAWVWVSCFILYDLAYYWKHRFGHEIALFWGSHVAHHQSEDYNLSTALRQTSIDFYGFLFYLPFFFLGFPAEILFSVVSLNLIYQFWVHTEHIHRLGILEWIFVTPSNHRVHHARNKIYVDRNYGGVFILWDRLFGSFQDELVEEKAVFGLRKPLNSWNPLWANTHVYWRLILDIIKVPGLKNKLLISFKPPGWMPEGSVSSCKLTKPVDISTRFDPAISEFCRYYTLTQFVLTVALSLFLLLNTSVLGYWQTFALVIFLVFSLYVHGVWLEAKTNARALEFIRIALAFGVVFLSEVNQVVNLAILALASISLLALLPTRKISLKAASTNEAGPEILA